MLRLLHKPFLVFLGVLLVVPAFFVALGRFAPIILGGLGVYVLWRLGNVLYHRRRRW